MVEVRTFWEWDADGVKRGERSYVPKTSYDALAAQHKQYVEWAEPQITQHGIDTARIAALEAELRAVEQWRERGAIVGVIVRDENGKDWRWDGSQWTSAETKAEYPYQQPSNTPAQSIGTHPSGGPCIHVWALTNRSAVENGKCELCGNIVNRGEKHGR